MAQKLEEGFEEMPSISSSNEFQQMFDQKIRQASIKRKSYYNRKVSLLARKTMGVSARVSTVEGQLRKDYSQKANKERAEERKKEMERTIETKQYYKSYRHFKDVEMMVCMTSLTGLILAIVSFEVNLIYNTDYLKTLSPIDLKSLRKESYI